ncbi:hypothetical protein LOZ53_006813 [Ophidiomyces ophidiicola]|nr:hypothetical protein LOZ55_004576 [Ophidiomyces ophidiicola]KAI1978925.1 hypothetical protein LOZ53_006813 [Ophidiomyces ophidiicola]KAI1999151.1 hypothetical protein LOZ51_001637 [Ophidiomyces ophidiicola]
MAPEELPSSWPESPFHGQMNSLMDQQWVSPSVTFAAVSHSYATSTHANPALLTPISAPNSAYLGHRQPPSHHSHSHSHDLHYHNISSSGVPHGLGISTLGYMQPGMVLYDQPHGTISEHSPYEHHAPPLRAHADRSSCDRASRAGTSQPISARSTPVAIAPNPLGVKQLEHERRGQELEAQRPSRRTRRPRRRSSILDEETSLTLQLREQNIPWNEVVKRVNAAFGGNHNASRLQMRITRLKQRMREWSEDDIQALLSAHSYWETDKFEIIAHKVSPTMQGYKTTRGWTASECQQKWQELHSEARESLKRSLSPEEENEPLEHDNKRPR